MSNVQPLHDTATDCARCQQLDQLLADMQDDLVRGAAAQTRMVADIIDTLGPAVVPAPTKRRRWWHR